MDVFLFALILSGLGYLIALNWVLKRRPERLKSCVIKPGILTGLLLLGLILFVSLTDNGHSRAAIDAVPSKEISSSFLRALGHAIIQGIATPELGRIAVIAVIVIISTGALFCFFAIGIVFCLVALYSSESKVGTGFS